MPHPMAQAERPNGSKTKTTPLDTSHLLDAASVAEYIGDFSTQFAALAERADLPLLAYLLDMVRLEAHLVTTRGATSRGGADETASKRLRVGRQTPAR